MPLKEVEVVVCFVDGGEADRDKEARESAAVFEASLVWRVKELGPRHERDNAQTLRTSFTSIAKPSSSLSCGPQTSMVLG